MIFLDVTSSCKSPMNTGVQRMVRGLFHHLSQHQKVTPLIWDNSWKSYCQLSLDEEGFLTSPFRAHRENLSHPERKANPFPWSKALRWAKHGVRRCRPSEGLVFVPEIFADHRAALWASRPFGNLPRTALFHDALAWSMPESAPPARRKGFENYLESLASFDRVICISQEAREDLLRFWQERNLAARPTHVLPWPMPLEGARPAMVSNFARKSILCVATLEPRKNHLRLLEACEKLWSGGLAFELVLVGRAIGGASEGVITLMESLQRRGRSLVWKRHVDEAALLDAYRDCSFTVYPSLREGFGLPVLESLWHCRPCVCADSGAIAEVAQGGGCLQVNPASVDALALGLRRLLEEPCVYEDLLEAAARRRFLLWPEYIQGLLDVLK